MNEILDTFWFSTSKGSMGVVKVNDMYDGIRYYLGQVEGFDPKQDSQFIADWGAIFPHDVGEMLFGTHPFQTGSAVRLPTSKEEAILMYQIARNYLGLRDE